MQKYFVNKQAQENGDHEVHMENCYYMPMSKLHLGYHDGCESAVTEARKTYPKANGCEKCCNPCHTS